MSQADFVLKNLEPTDPNTPYESVFAARKMAVEFIKQHKAEWDAFVNPAPLEQADPLWKTKICQKYIRKKIKESGFRVSVLDVRRLQIDYSEYDSSQWVTNKLANPGDVGGAQGFMLCENVPGVGNTDDIFVHTTQHGTYW